LGDRGTPRLTADEVITILKRHGFCLAGQAGSHQKWRNAANGKQVIVAYHTVASFHLEPCGQSWKAAAFHLKSGLAEVEASLRNNLYTEHRLAIIKEELLYWANR
jgi:predicted RNA binding protein YcfA (HicA-like mRNA interferase family)